MTTKIGDLPLDNSVSGADFIPVVDTSVVPNVTKRVRVEDLFQYTHVYDLTTASDVYIDAINGSDSNDGISSTTALKSHAEFERRVSGRTITPPYNTDPIGTGDENRALTIHILSSLPSSDPINIRFQMAIDSTLYYTAGTNILQTLATGTITATTPMTPASNVPNQITDSSLPSGFTPYVGERLRITSGANQNAIAWIAKDLGSKAARISNPCTWTPYDPTQGPTYGSFGQFIFDIYPKTLTVGDHYAIEKLFEVTMGVFEPNGMGAGPGFWFFNITIDNLHVVGNAGWTTYGPNSYWNVAQCRIDATLYLKNVEESYWLNCSIDGGTFVEGPALISAFHAGLIRGVGVDCAGNSIVNMNLDVMLQGCGMRGHRIAIQSACVFDAVEGITTSGNAVDVGRIQIHTSQPFYLAAGAGMARTQTLQHDANIRLWGSGNAGFGVNVGAGCTFYIPENEPPYTMIPTITGTAGDFGLNGSATGRAWNESTGTWTAAITNTWAHLAATTGAGGFNGNAQNVAQRAAIVKIPNP